MEEIRVSRMRALNDLADRWKAYDSIWPHNVSDLAIRADGAIVCFDSKGYFLILTVPSEEQDPQGRTGEQQFVLSDDQGRINVDVLVSKDDIDLLLNEFNMALGTSFEVDK